MSPQYLLVAPLVLGATTVYPVGCNDTLLSLSISCWYHLYPSATAVSPGGSPGTLVQLKYLLVTPLVSQCTDSIFGYLLMTHCYPCATTVSHIGPTHTQVSHCISWWLHWYRSANTVYPDSFISTLVSLQFLRVAALVPVYHYIIF